MPAQKVSVHEEPTNTNHGQVLDFADGGQQKDASFQLNAHFKQHSFHQQNRQHQLEEDEEDEEEENQEDGDEEEDDDDDDDEEDEGEGTEGTRSSSSSEDETEQPEYVIVELSEIRKDVQCPICLGIIKKTRTVMECLHRFCRECIDKSMRMGNNECPACRTHCASRRSLRDDPNYDTLIAALYPDIDKYEEEELAFHEEERTRNKQIQASIAQIFERQSEALVRRRPMGKETTSFMSRLQRSDRIAKRRRSSRGAEFGVSEDNEEENDNNGGKNSSSADEPSTELRVKKRRRRSGARQSQPSSSVANSEGGCTENDTEVSRENRGLSPGLAWNTERLAWGRGGTRSHTRHGNSANSSSKNARNARLSKLVGYLRSLEQKNDELDMHLTLVSLDKQKLPSLRRPYLCCQPSLSVRHLCEYVAHQTTLSLEEIELLLVKSQHSLSTPTAMDELHILKSQDTLAGLKAYCATGEDQLVSIFGTSYSLSDLYESLIFLSWGFSIIHMIPYFKKHKNFLRAITAPSAFFTQGFVTSGLLTDIHQSEKLVPALQSQWLMMHVSMMLLGYATLLCGSLLSVALLVITFRKVIRIVDKNNFLLNDSFSFGEIQDMTERSNFLRKTFFISSRNYYRFQLIEQLDHWGYRIISIGFVFLTIGILSGAVWANEAWGSYWNWDPKETWAFITWIVFAIYFHTRTNKITEGLNSAIIASIGFLIIWICYFGVNLLGIGLHSYGSFTLTYN